MAPRIIVGIELVAGGRKRAACHTQGCTELDGGPWRGEAHSVKAAADDDALRHRQWHRRQRAAEQQAEAAG